MTPRRPSDHDLLHDASGVDDVRALCHDLRQPLAAILLLSESGLGDPGEAAGHHPRRGPVAGDDDRRRARRGPVDRPDVVDVLHVVRGCVERAEPTAACSLSVTGRSGAEAFVPPVALGRAVGCILDNAIRAAGPHGSVTVEVREDSGHVQVVVQDDGPGLGKVPAHTSMGLTITAALVSASGGEFTLTPRPVWASRALARIVLPGLGARAVAGFTRLVVCDDHRLLVDALTMALQDEGHEVVATPVRPGEAVDACPGAAPANARLLDGVAPRRRAGSA